PQRLGLPARSMPLPLQPPPIPIDDEEQDTGLLPASLVEATKTVELPDGGMKTNEPDAGLADAEGPGAVILAADTMPDIPPLGQGIPRGENFDQADDDTLPPAQGQPITANLPSTPAATSTGTPRKKPTNPLSKPPDPPIIDLLPPKAPTGRRTKTLPAMP